MKRFLFILIILSACSIENSNTNLADTAGWERWKVDRMTELKSPEGFLNLAGLFWLKEGDNSFGADETNDAVFPDDLPEVMGSLRLEGTKVFLDNPVEGILLDSASFDGGLIFDFEEGYTGILTYQSYVWYVIKRTEDIGVRLKNLDHPNLKKDIDIHFFDYQSDLVVEAVFEPYVAPKKLRIENVFGHQFDMNIRGQLKFELFGKPYTLEPMDEGDKLFIIFSDQTSAVETYGSGRYLYAQAKPLGEKVLLDFNRAKNPPCAFTDFATCLIPPPENRLELRIEAGEYDYHMD